ncbi:MAG TPA: helix-turn-helix domain-containing protein [Gemmataceae bacterium]|nr:helix-turn-helix domain-containing protein [Gemmataceae bacterium]
MPRPVLTFARFVATPENRAAWLAVKETADGLLRSSGNDGFRLVLLHGPAGCGKTHLVTALVAEVTQERRDVVVAVLAAGDLARADHASLFGDAASTAETDDDNALEEARHCDLLIVEDLQHLSVRAAESLVQAIDYLEARRRPMVFTANAGPQRLVCRGQRLPARIANRLAAGLVIGLKPLGPQSRLTLLQTLAQRRQLAVGTDVLRWLAERLTGGGRQLEGAIGRLETLAKGQRGPLDLAEVEAAFREEIGAGEVTIERIVQRVGGYYCVEPSDLQSSRRSRNVLLPRQVSMYLARRLTPLSLQQIGEYFGGRDHSTVLHACNKLEKMIGSDAVLSGAVREIHAALA